MSMVRQNAEIPTLKIKDEIRGAMEAYAEYKKAEPNRAPLDFLHLQAVVDARWADKYREQGITEESCQRDFGVSRVRFLASIAGQQFRSEVMEQELDMISKKVQRPFRQKILEVAKDLVTSARGKLKIAEDMATNRPRPIGPELGLS